MSTLRILFVSLSFAALAEGQASDIHGDPLPPGALARLGRVRPFAEPGNETVAFRADGKSIVTLNWGKYVSIFDRDTGRLIERRTLPTEPTRYCVLFQDGRRAMFERRPGGRNKPAEWEFWDLDLAKKLTTVVPGPDSDYYVVPAPNGDFMATADVLKDSMNQWRAARLRVWDTQTGKVRQSEEVAFEPDRRIGGHSRPILSPDGKRLVFQMIVNDRLTVLCWSIADLKLLWQREFEDAEVDLGVFNDRVFATYCVDGTNREKPWTVDLETGRDVADSLPRELSARVGCAVSNGIVRYFARKGDDWEIRSWDLKQNRQVRGPATPLRPRSGLGMILSPDGRYAMLSGYSFDIYDLERGTCLWSDSRAAGHSQAVTAISFAATSDRAASSAWDHQVLLWKVSEGRPVGQWNANALAGLEGGLSVELSHDGRRFAFPSSGTNSGVDWSIDVIDPESHRKPEEGMVLKSEHFDAEVSRLGFSHSAQSLFTAVRRTDRESSTCWLVRIDFPSDKWTKLGEVPWAPSNRTAWDRRNLRWIVAGKVFDARTGKQALELAGAIDGPFEVVRSGALIAGLGTERAGQVAPSNICVWEADTGRIAVALPWRAPAGLVGAETCWPRVLALHPSSRYLATADIHGVRLWDLASQRVVHEFAIPMKPPPQVNHGSPATALAFTPDGTRLATGLPDGTILLWPVPIPGPVSLPTETVDRLWLDLMSPNAEAGWRAAWLLADAPDDLERVARERIRPAANIPQRDLKQLVADLDSPEFRKRESAAKRLQEVAGEARSLLAEALKQPGSEEHRVRLTKALEFVPDRSRPLSPINATITRLVAAVERAGASELLAEWAGGTPDAWLTREAKAAFGRVNATGLR